MTIQVGSVVRPIVGPHKNEAHEVIHIFEDGHANIRLIDGESAYKVGHITADPKFLNEEVLVEEYSDPTGSWWHNASKATKESYRANHPDNQGTFGQEPGSQRFHRMKSKAHQKYADFHEAEMNHHIDKRADAIEGRKFNSDKINHHSNLRDEHAGEFYHHSMRSAHHGALASGAKEPHVLEVATSPARY